SSNLAMRSASSMTMEGRFRMKKKLFWTLAALAATPLSAGVVYVPLPGYQTVGNFAVEPRILVSNQATNDWAYRPLLLAAETPGTAQTDPGPYSPVGAGKTLELLPPPGHRGLVQFVSAPQLVWSARLVRLGDPESQGSFLPVITSENAAAAGSDIHLQGWDRTNASLTDLMLVNLAETSSQCTIAVYRAGGSQIGSTAAVTVQPLSSRIFTDTIGMLGDTNETAVRAKITCDKLFYAF